MSHEAVGRLIDRWLNDREFREQLRRDPAGTVRRTGVELSEEEWQVFRKIDWKLSDNELKTRITKVA